MTFPELGLSAPLLRAIASEGYTAPTPIQSQAIPHVMAGSDLLGCAQTGTGKTAAFALPILHRLSQAGAPPRGAPRKVRVLVLSPTRELAAQIGESFRTYGRHTPLRHTVIYGGVGQGSQVGALRQGVDVLVATPGRLVDLLQQGHVDLRSVEVFVLDEADRMLDMGFLPDLRRVLARLPAQRQTVFFSATMPPAIEQLAHGILRQPVRIWIAPVQATSALIEESVCFVPQQQKSHLLARWLATKPIARALVFTRTKHGADRVARDLNRAGIRAEAMHGNKSQSARQRVLASFKSPRPPIVVATDLAARGIDVDGISHVFNFDLPREPETYLHRIGRTGRAGASGVAVSFCDHAERKHLKDIERLIRRSIRQDQEHPLESLGAPPLAANGSTAARERRPQSGDRRHTRNGQPTVGRSPGGAKFGRGPRGRRRRVATSSRL
jgi:ATP-dependent RNA helicase RhlE